MAQTKAQREAAKRLEERNQRIYKETGYDPNEWKERSAGHTDTKTRKETPAPSYSNNAARSVRDRANSVDPYAWQNRPAKPVRKIEDYKPIWGLAGIFDVIDRMKKENGKKENTGSSKTPDMGKPARKTEGDKPIWSIFDVLDAKKKIENKNAGSTSTIAAAAPELVKQQGEGIGMTLQPPLGLQDTPAPPNPLMTPLPNTVHWAGQDEVYQTNYNLLQWQKNELPKLAEKIDQNGAKLKELASQMDSVSASYKQSGDQSLVPVYDGLYQEYEELRRRTTGMIGSYNSDIERFNTVAGNLERDPGFANYYGAREQGKEEHAESVALRKKAAGQLEGGLIDNGFMDYAVYLANKPQKLTEQEKEDAKRVQDILGNKLTELSKASGIDPMQLYGPEIDQPEYLEMMELDLMIGRLANKTNPLAAILTGIQSGLPFGEKYAETVEKTIRERYGLDKTSPVQYQSPVDVVKTNQPGAYIGGEIGGSLLSMFGIGGTIEKGASSITKALNLSGKAAPIVQKAIANTGLAVAMEGINATRPGYDSSQFGINVLRSTLLYNVSGFTGDAITGGINKAIVTGKIPNELSVHLAKNTAAGFGGAAAGVAATLPTYNPETMPSQEELAGQIVTLGLFRSVGDMVQTGSAAWNKNKTISAMKEQYQAAIREYSEAVRQMSTTGGSGATDRLLQSAQERIVHSISSLDAAVRSGGLSGMDVTRINDIRSIFTTIDGHIAGMLGKTNVPAVRTTGRAGAAPQGTAQAIAEKYGVTPAPELKTMVELANGQRGVVTGKNGTIYTVLPIGGGKAIKVPASEIIATVPSATPHIDKYLPPEKIAERAYKAEKREKSLAEIGKLLDYLLPRAGASPELATPEGVRIPGGEALAPNTIMYSMDRNGRVQANLTEEERARILSQKTIKVPKAKPELLNQVDLQKLENIYRRKAKPLLREIVKKFGINKTYSNTDIEFEFAYSGKSLNESVAKQNSSYDNMAKMFTTFDDIIENAVAIEAHGDRYRGTDRADNQLTNTYVLLSAYFDGKNTIPVKLVIKEFDGDAQRSNKIYMAVTAEKIGADLLAQTMPPAGGGSASFYATSAPELSVAELVKKINAADRDLLKYIPDQMLTLEQRAGKAAALEREQAKYEAIVRGETRKTGKTGHAPKKGIADETDLFGNNRRRKKEENLPPGSGKLIGYQEIPQYREFRSQLKRCDPDARKVLDRALEKVDILISKNKEALFNYKHDYIQLWKDAPPSTLAHEAFHRYDMQEGISGKYRFGDILRKEYEAMTQDPEDLLAYMRQEYPEAFKENIERKVRLKLEYRGISDILSGLTRNELLLGYGHRDNYWGNDDIRLGREAWAQLGRILYENDPRVIAMLKDLFPKFYECAMIAVKGVK